MSPGGTLHAMILSPEAAGTISLVLVRPVPVGAPVGPGPAGLYADLPRQCPRHRPVAHPEQEGPRGIWNGRDMCAVLVDPHRNLRPEVGQAWAPGLKPDPLQRLQGPALVGLPATLPLPVFDVAAQEFDDSLARHPDGAAYLIEHLRLPVRCPQFAIITDTVNEDGLLQSAPRLPNTGHCMSSHGSRLTLDS